MFSPELERKLTWNLEPMLGDSPSTCTSAPLPMACGNGLRQWLAAMACGRFVEELEEKDKHRPKTRTKIARGALRPNILSIAGSGITPTWCFRNGRKKSGEGLMTNL